MGTWGTGILDNDNSGDFYDSFFEHYESGIEPSEIIKKLHEEYPDLNEESDSICDFWFTIALAMWEICALDKSTLERVTKYIQEEKDIKIWTSLDADEKTIKERKRELNKFLKKIQAPREKLKSRKVKKKRPPVFKKGDLISFQLNNGNYGGAIVIQENGLKEFWLASNIVVLTRMNQKNKPTKNDFLNSEILIMNVGDYRDGIRVSIFGSDNFNLFKNDFFLIDNVEINRNFDSFLEKNKPGFTMDWGLLLIDINTQNEFEQNNKEPRKKITVKKFINNVSKWKFW